MEEDSSGQVMFTFKEEDEDNFPFFQLFSPLANLPCQNFLTDFFSPREMVTQQNDSKKRHKVNAG